jgi:hypothetical protein
MLSSYKNENIQDLDSYGIDVASELESLLVEELSKSIDMEIMKQVFKAHRDYRKEKTKKILDKIQQMKEKGI